MDRPPYIRHVNDLDARELSYDGLSERFGERASISRPLGLTRLGVHRDRLAPGERSSLPHAERTEEEMVVVIAGYPSAWIQGELYRLRPGDVVVFEPGTGIAHTIVNDSAAPVDLLVVGERREDNQWMYPLDPGRRDHTPEGKWWEDPPAHTMGAHEGRARAAEGLRLLDVSRGAWALLEHPRRGLLMHVMIDVGQVYTGVLLDLRPEDEVAARAAGRPYLTALADRLGRGAGFDDPRRIEDHALDDEVSAALRAYGARAGW
jgi:uncharacterized cupin superfamily protein